MNQHPNNIQIQGSFIFAGKWGCVGRGCLEHLALKGKKVTKDFKTFVQRTLWGQIWKSGAARCKALIVSHLTETKTRSCLQLHMFAFRGWVLPRTTQSTESHNLLKQEFFKLFYSQTYFIIKYNFIIILKNYKAISLHLCIICLRSYFSWEII